MPLAPSYPFRLGQKGGGTTGLLDTLSGRRGIPGLVQASADPGKNHRLLSVVLRFDRGDRARQSTRAFA